MEAQCLMTKKVYLYRSDMNSMLPCLAGCAPRTLPVFQPKGLGRAQGPREGTGRTAGCPWAGMQAMSGIENTAARDALGNGSVRKRLAGPGQRAGRWGKHATEGKTRARNIKKGRDRSLGPKMGYRTALNTRRVRRRPPDRRTTSVRRRNRRDRRRRRSGAFPGPR